MPLVEKEALIPSGPVPFSGRLCSSSKSESGTSKETGESRPAGPLPQKAPAGPWPFRAEGEEAAPHGIQRNCRGRCPERKLRRAEARTETSPDWHQQNKDTTSLRHLGHLAR